MKRPQTLVVVLSLLAAVVVAQSPSPTPAPTSTATPGEAAITALIAEHQQRDALLPFDGLFVPGSRVVEVGRDGARWRVVMSGEFAARTWDDASRAAVEAELARALGATPADIALFVRLSRDGGNVPIENLLTTREAIRARQTILAGEDRWHVPAPAAPLVQRVSSPAPAPTGGLAGRHLVVSPSHGWTWHREQRWQYQRARLFTTVEDQLPMSFINPFLIPMLENAGAVVLSTRERDFQTAEVIVDNDGADVGSTFVTKGAWQAVEGAGWRGGRPAILPLDVAPFTLGTTMSTGAADASATYTPEFPRTGRYGVTMAWRAAATNSPAVPVTIRHRGGESRVLVNQQVAGCTWIHLGFYEFDAGRDETTGSVSIQREGAAPADAANPAATTISVDAVRFGGGMGNVAPGNAISGQPRYAEGALYWMHYAGASPAVYAVNAPGNDHFGLDYWRDITSRGEWPNWLVAAPNVPREAPTPALRPDALPVDLMVSWHTDAGQSADGIIGTLTIYNLPGHLGDATLPDGRSRLLNRDLAALIHDEFVRAARGRYSSTWQRRALMPRDLGEARRPNVPSVLLETFSHQNLHDMQYGLDPRFRRDMARAVYKACLRFVAYAHNFDPMITPLEPTHLAARHLGEGRVEVTWRAQADDLEPTAAPTSYIVQRSRDGVAFDNGTLTTTTRFEDTGVPAGEPRYYRVVAANPGGVSFPSSVVGVCWMAGAEPVLVVDGFDRLAPPALVWSPEAQGFDRKADPGVGYQATYGLVGDQYDFDPKSPWKNDLEAPGHGASRHDHEGRLEPGNTFDHVRVMGATLDRLDRAFDSCTQAAFGELPTTPDTIVWIAGRQRTTPPPRGMSKTGMPDHLGAEFEVLTTESRRRLNEHFAAGGRLLISGSYVGEDLTVGPRATRDSVRFARESLGLTLAFEHRSAHQSVAPEADAAALADVGTVRYAADLQQPINLLETTYPVPSAEAYEHDVEGTRALLTHADSDEPAAVRSPHAVVVGFPLETVVPVAKRDALVKGLLAELGADVP